MNGMHITYSAAGAPDHMSEESMAFLIVDVQSSYFLEPGDRVAPS